MSWRNMGLGAGLMLGGGLMLFGIVVMAFASSAPGGGIMIVLGLLFFLPGVFIAGSTLLAWLSVRLYGSLDSSAKRKVKWGVFVFLPLAWLAWSAVESYLYMRPSAVAEREAAEAQRAKVEAQRALIEEEARQKFEAANEYLVGAWQDTAQSGHVIMFDDRGRTYRTDGGEIHQYESWRLSLKDREPSFVIELHIYGGHGGTGYEVLQVDDAQLVTRFLTHSGNTKFEQGSETQSFSRITDAPTLRQFYPKAGSIIMQVVRPGTQSKIINGVAHRFFEKPVAVSTWGGVVRSGPGMEYSKVASMYKGDPVALVAVTDAEMEQFKWFQIRYRDGQNGYAMGGLLCPKEAAIEGIREHC